MKKLVKMYIPSLLLLSSVFITYGQKSYLDSVCVQVNESMKLSMAIYSYNSLKEAVEKDMKSLQLILKERNGIPGNESYSINYEPEKYLSVKPEGAGERIIWENNKKISYQLNNQCNIFSDNYFLQIQFNDFNDLISDSLINKLNEVIDSTNTIQGRFASTYNYSFRGKELIHNKEKNKIIGQMDALSVKGGVGLNLIKNQPIIDLSAEMGFIFNKKGIWKNQYYLSYNQLSDFRDDSKVNLNSFANIGYRYNLSKTVGNPNWLGVEFGYLTIRHGDLFEKNTFKLGVNWEIGKYISISPQLYLSGKSTYPAVRIGFGF